MPPALLRLLSYVWPVRAWKGDGAHGSIELVWEYGRLVVNSADANQSFGTLHTVWQQVFRDERIKERRPGNVLILGSGAGSVAHILVQELGLDPRITGVDDDPAMLQLARDHFGVSAMKNLQLHHGDAFRFAEADSAQYGLVVVDLFHNDEFLPGVAEAPFLRQLRRLASPGGLVAINTMVQSPELARRSARVGEELRLLFTEVKERRYEGDNRVFIAL